MPIKPENKARYPKEWPDIRAEVLRRADNMCEFCGVENYAMGRWFENHWHVAHWLGSCENDRPRTDRPHPCHFGESVIWARPIRIVLTIAHLDHQPEHNGERGNRPNLKALCQRCHLRYDAKHHAHNAARTRRDKASQPDLLDTSAAAAVVSDADPAWPDPAEELEG